MPQKIKVMMGDVIDYGNDRKGQIEKIRIISSGKLLEEYEYDGDGHDLVLTLRGNNGVINLWVKDTHIQKVPEEKKG
jgi:hypothetical protein